MSMTQIALITLDELLKSLPNGDTAVQVRRAYTFAEKIHNGRYRETNELHIDHNLAVAHIGLGDNTQLRKKRRLR